MTSSSPISPVQIPTSTPVSSRERSDTVLTTSSSDSFPNLQTPQTSILGILNGNHTEPFKYTVESPSDVLSLGRNRQNSYGFGNPLSASPEIIPQSLSVQDGQSSSSDIRSAETSASSRYTFNFTLEPPIQLDLPSPPLDLPSAASLPRDSSTIEITSLIPTDPNHRNSISTEASTDASEPTPDSRRSKLKAVVRRKLERSKSSLRSLRRFKDDEVEVDDSGPSNTPSVLDVNIPTPSTPGNNGQLLRPRKSRLKSLLTFSRTPSSLSIKSIQVSSSKSGPRLDGSSHRQNQERSCHLPSHIAHHEITIRDFAHSPPTVSPAVVYSRHFSVNGVPQINSHNKLRTATSRSHDQNGVTQICETTSAHPARITRTMSMPLPDTTAQNLLTEEPEEIVEEKTDYFGTVLPRELKVLIMKTLLDIFKSERGNRRWSGEIGGRRELIKLSRALCLDGQLWSTINLTPYAHVIHTNTVKRIVTHSLPFITTLSFRGLDILRGSVLIPALSPLDWSSNPHTESLAVWLPNLRNLDFRGVIKIKSSDICAIIAGSPGLKCINMKAVHACNSEVIRTIARSTRQLESLDVSRCKELTLGDMIFLISTMDEAQSSKFKCLRIGGMKSYGRHASDFLPLLAKKLINLEVFDAQGCTHLFDEDFEKFSSALNESGRKSQITHLNLSECSALKGRFLIHLKGKLPNLRILELSNLIETFREDSDAIEVDLIGFIKTVPKIQRIDLDLTGLHGGLSDKVLDTFWRFRPNDTDDILGKNLIELRIGHAKDITSEGLVRLIKNCPNLDVLEIDNTSADNSVLQTFLKHHPKGTISLIDCRSLTTSELDKHLPTTLCRSGYNGWENTPFGYTSEEIKGNKAIIKNFQSWRNSIVPKSWKEIRFELDNSPMSTEGGDDGDDKGRKRRERKNSWWSTTTTTVQDVELEEDTGGRGCLIM